MISTNGCSWTTCRREPTDRYVSSAFGGERRRTGTSIDRNGPSTFYPSSFFSSSLQNDAEDDKRSTCAHLFGCAFLRHGNDARVNFVVNWCPRRSGTLIGEGTMVPRSFFSAAWLRMDGFNLGQEDIPCELGCMHNRGEKSKEASPSPKTIGQEKVGCGKTPSFREQSLHTLA